MNTWHKTGSGRRGRRGFAPSHWLIAGVIGAVLLAAGPSAARPAATCTLVGTRGNDVLVGKRSRDVICGFAGNDRLYGNGGNDVVYAGLGHDSVAGGRGRDVLYGEAGNDTIAGNDGNDTINPGAGVDRVAAGAGTDRILARDGGLDTLNGGAGTDTASVDASDRVILVERVSRPLERGAVTVVAVGDIACDPSDPDFRGGEGTGSACRQRATSDLALSLKPAAVLTLGDNQYVDGTYEKFLRSFHPTWGRLKQVTRPVPGNHEYSDPAGPAAGYFKYFGPAAGDPARGYYSFDVGSWHLVALNSECKFAGGCSAGSPQERWLRADLAAHRTRCTLAYWHRPRFSSGPHGSSSTYDAFWRTLDAAGADVVLNGHDHIYERFARQTPDARPSEAGIREFIVGTGGRSTYSVFATQAVNTQIRRGDSYGVLSLTLKDGGYDWAFVSAPPSPFTDTGSDTCR